MIFKFLGFGKGQDTPEDPSQYKPEALDPKDANWSSIRPLMKNLLAQEFDRLKQPADIVDKALGERSTTVLLKDSSGTVVGFSIAIRDLAVIDVADMTATVIRKDLQGNKGLVATMMNHMEPLLAAKGVRFLTRTTMADNATDKIQEHFKKRIVDTKEFDSSLGKQHITKVDLKKR